VSTTNSTNFAVNLTTFFIDLDYTWDTLYVSTFKGSSSGVSTYTFLITELKREISIFLFTYTYVTYVFINSIISRPGEISEIRKNSLFKLYLRLQVHQIRVSCRHILILYVPEDSKQRTFGASNTTRILTSTLNEIGAAVALDVHHN
jgi:hypothetical protein